MTKLRKCFIIMPFSDTIHGDKIKITAAQWNHIYTDWIKKAVESSRPGRFQCKRSPALPGNFVRGIVADLSNAELVIADLTGNKTNVFYELGIRHALRTGTISITQDIRSVPSDLKSYYTFEYQYSDKTHEYEDAYKRFEKSLHEKIDGFGTGDVLSDSPVSDFLGFRAEIEERKLEIEKIKMKRLLIECGRAFEHNYKVCENMFKLLTKGAQLPFEDIPIIDLLPIDAALHAVLSSTSEIFPEQTNELLRTTINIHRKILLNTKLFWDSYFQTGAEQSAVALDAILHVMVKSEIPKFKKGWPAVIKALDKAEVIATVRRGRKRTVFRRQLKG
jgi:hypothetical protein